MKDQAARRIIENDLEHNLLVEAGAGSGKTHSLVTRIRAGILAGSYAVENIAAVTFTRKAAGELSTRLRLALETEASRHQRAAFALENFSEMFIGTVHSFCGRILRHYPVQAGISPAFREIESLADQQLQRRVLRNQLERPEGRRLLRLLAEFGAGPAQLAPALFALSDRGELDYAPCSQKRPELERTWEQLDQFADELSPLLPNCGESEPTCKLLVLARSLADQCSLAGRESPRDLLRLLSAWETAPRVVKRYWGEQRHLQEQALSPVLARVEKFRSQVAQPQLAAWRSHLYALALPFLLTTRSVCQEERRQRGWVSYNDLLRLCRLLCRSHPQVLDSLQKRYRHLFVDEFQDTDPLQAEIFMLLAADTPQPGVWTEITPRPASLFLVGDPKQSIYRFRHADIEVYQQVRRQLESTGGTVVALTTSFRSRARLCAWINRTFSQLLPPQATPQQAAFIPLEARDESTDSASPAVVRLIQSSPRMLDVCRDEAEQIADFIATTPGNYRDYLILTSRRVDLLPYQQALTRRGIPYQSSAEPQAIRPEVAQFLQILAVLANPMDSIGLVGILRGAYFGHSDQELFDYVQRHGFLSLRPDQEKSSEVALSLLQLGQLTEQIRTLPPGAAAYQVAESLGIHLKLSPTDLESVVDSLAQRSENGLTLAQAVQEIEEEGELLPTLQSSGSGNAVRVLNVHKAKGLEARIVFLAAPTQGLPLQVDHALDETGKAALALRTQHKLLAHPPHWELWQSRERAYLEAERTRLLYVAVTRARELLVVGGWSGPRGLSPRPWGALEPFLEELPELVRPMPEPLPPLPDTARSLHNAQQLQQRRDQQRARLRQPSWRRLAVSTANKHSGLPSSLPVDSSQGSGKDWGDLIHKLLEQLVLQPDLGRSELELLARWFSLDHPELQPYLDAALDQLERVRQGPFWSRVLAARERLVEVPFGHRSGDTFIFGIIDLVLDGHHGWDIVDYKTDRKHLEDLLSAYASQIEQYAMSWSEISGQPVHSTGILGIRAGEYRQYP